MVNTIESIGQKFVLPVTESGCWLWMGCLNAAGYGVIHYQNKRWLAHRLLYADMFGPLKQGTLLDHLCRVRSCVNPRHLELVTHAINTARGLGRKRDFCPQDHPYSGKNLYIKPDGTQMCRACRRDEMRRKNGWLGKPACKERTHCPQGHPYSPENTFITKEGYRHCRECERKRHREWSRLKTAANPKPRKLPSFLGQKHTEEAKARMSAAALGRKHSEATRAKMSRSRQGRSISPETRAKISATKLLRKPIKSFIQEEDDAVA